MICRLFLSFGVAAACAAAADAPLVEAARKQDAKAVRALLAKKTPVNVQAADGSTALLWLAHWNDASTAELLLKAGAAPDTANDFGMTPLAEACTNASVELVGLLLRAGANPNKAIDTTETPLMTCARTGNPDTVRLLIDHGAQVNAKEAAQNQTALMWAASERHSNVVKLLIDAKADLTARSKQGFTALHFAARVGDLESVQTMLGAGMDIDILTQTGDGPKARTQGNVSNALGFAKTQGALGYTPLLVATVRGQVETALYLLDHGADPNILTAGFAPLHWAAGEWESFAANPVYGFRDAMAGIQDRGEKLKLVKALLAHGANVNARMTKPQPSFAGGYLDATGATPFLLASAAIDLEMMKLLLAAGADPKIKTATNASAIMAAAGLNHFIGETLFTEAQGIEVLQFLLELGVEPKGETTFGENALFGPAYRGWNTMLKQLIDLGVNVNAVSKAGVTPWLAANGQGDRLGGVLYNGEGADLLLKAGADPKLGRPCEAQNRCRALAGDDE